MGRGMNPTICMTVWGVSLQCICLRRGRRVKTEYVYKYDFLDRLIDTIRPDGSHQRQIRDGEGNILKNVHPNAYDALTDDGEGIRYEYDSDGNNIRIHYPDGGCERIFYDAEGKRTKHVMPEYYDPILDDGIGTSYEYDFAGRLAKIILPDGTVEAEYGYDLSGNILTKTDALGHTSYYAYDLRGNLTRSLVPSKKNRMRTFTRRLLSPMTETGTR